MAIEPSAIQVPSDINQFFNTLYGTSPEAEQKKKNTLYSVADQGVTITTDPYGGCHIDVKELPQERFQFAKEAIQQLTEAFEASHAFDSLWIDMATPFTLSTLGQITPDSFTVGESNRGDLIYDYQQKKIKIWKWLSPDKECTIPPAATHNIGASGLIIDSVAQKVLLIVNVRRDDAWNLPGGSYDPALDNTPAFTAVREAQEEGGFEVAKEELGAPKLIGQIQFPYNQFAPAINQIWAYSIDGVSEKELTPPPEEVKHAEWVNVADVMNSEGKLGDLKLGDEIKVPLIAAINGLGCEMILDKGWMVVHAPSV